MTFATPPFCLETMSIFDRFNEWIDDLRVPDDALREMDHAERLLRDGHPTEAFSALRALDSRRPGLWRVQFLLGLSQEALGRLDDAAGYYREAIAQRSEPIARLALARTLNHQGRFDEARDQLVRAADDARSKRDEMDALEMLAELEEHQHRWDDAARTWARLRSHDTTSTAWRLREAIARENAGESEVAIELLRHAPEANDAVRLALARLLLAEHDDDAPRPQETGQAFAEIEALLDTVDESQRDWRWWLARAQLLRRQHGDTSTVASLREALEEAPLEAHAEIHRELARALLLAGTAEAALDHAEAAALMESSTAAHVLAIEAAVDAGHLSVAERHARQVIAEQPNHARVRVLLARAHLEREQTSEARALLAPLRRSELTADARLVLARLALATGDPLEAISMLQEIGGDASTSEREAMLRAALDALTPTLPQIPTDAEPDAIVLTDVLAFVADLATRHALLTSYAPTINHLRASLEEPLSIAVAGEFNAGKSTLINAWLGEQVLATGVLPTTSHVNRIGYGPRTAARIEYVTGGIEEISFSEAAVIVKEEPERIARLEFGFPHPTLRSVNFLDTPGFNAPDDDHEDRAEQALRQADAVLWVLDARQALTQTEFRRLRAIPDANRRLLVIVNKIDRYEAGEIDEIADHVRSAVGDRCVGVFLLSALDAERAAADDRAVPEAFSAFREALRTTFFERTSELKALETRRRLDAVLKAMRDDASGSADVLDERMRALKTQRTASLERWQQAHLDRPRTIIQTLSSAVRALRDEIVGTLRGAESGVRILGTALGSSLDRRAVDDLQIRLRLALKRAVEAAVEELLDVSRGMEHDGLEAIEQIANKLDRDAMRTLRRRVESHHVAREGHRQLLREQLVGRALVAFDTRFETAGVPTLLRLSGRDLDSLQANREIARLLPLRPQEWHELAERWLATSVESYSQLLEQVERDIEILRIDIEHRIVRPLDSVYEAIHASTAAARPSDTAPDDL